jgi:hypothetical protein
MRQFIAPLSVCNATVSHGTLHPRHLAHRFVAFLREIGHPLAHDLRVQLYAIQSKDGLDSDELIYFVDELINVLNDASPFGYAFQSHIGDGSDFGYWQWEDVDAYEMAYPLNYRETYG